MLPVIRTTFFSSPRCMVAVVLGLDGRSGTFVLKIERNGRNFVNSFERKA